MIEEVEQTYAEWTTAFINDLPDSAFLYIAPGGEKDDDGRTTPRSLRYFPYRDATGKVDLPHLRNAIAQAPKAKLSADIIAKVQAKGRKILEGEREEDMSETPEESEEIQEDQQEASREVEQMSEWSEALRLDDVEIDKTVELARSGTHYGRASDRKVSLSVEDIESMSRGYALIKSEGWFSTGAPVGYNHAAISGALDAESTKAAGRIIDVHVRANDDGSASLMGTVRWTEEAKRRIRAGEFDGFSIEAVPADGARSKKTGEKLGEWALIGGTLTNEPFVAGMQPVAASEKRNPDMGTSNISQALSLGEGVTETEILAEIESLRERAAKADSLSEALDTVTEDRDTIKAKFEELEAKEIERMLDRACADGRIAASERDDYLDIYTHCGEERANRAYFLNRIGVTEIGNAGTDAERVQRSSVSAECTALAEKISAEEGLDPAAAFARAMQAVLSDPTKLAAYDAENLDS
jgi:hypothetical protein